MKKLIFLLFTITLFCFNSTISAQESSTSGGGLSLSKEFQYINQIHAQKKAIRAQRDLLSELRKRIEELENRETPDSPPSRPDVTTTEDNSEEIAALKKTIRILRKENTQYEQQIKKLAIEVANYQVENVQLTNDLSDLRNDFSSLQDDFSKLEKETEILRSTVACFADFSEKRKAKKADARSKIEEANNLVSFRKNETRLSDADERTRTKEAFVIYLEYGGGADSTSCNGQEFFYQDDYLTGTEHLDILKMVAQNEYNIIELLGENTGDMIRKSNSMMLENLAAVYKNGNYNEQSDVADIAEKIGFYLEGERKGNAKTNASETLLKIRKIKQAFDNDEYATALTLYNKYERYFTLKDIAVETNTIAEAHYAVSLILIWNLGDVLAHRELFIKDTWLDNIAKNPVGKAKLLLIEKVISNQELDNQVLKKKAARTLTKIYLP